ncbi:MAG: hypothetical protein HY812_04200 [Planctomycetes bacterium]|nr:hypothetical protein [Planctomycetota bacterium]
MKSEEDDSLEEIDPEDPGDATDSAGALRAPAVRSRSERAEAAGKRHKKRRKGVFDARRVRFISFVVIAIGLFVASTFCILAIWKYASRDTAWRALSTLGVVAGTMFTFTIINEMFGSSMEE